MSTTTPPRFEPIAEAWIQQHGLAPPAGEHPDWGLQIALSTVPPFDWTARRSKIGPTELWFGIGLSRILGWRASLFTRDDTLKVTWRGNGTLEVESPSIVHRHRTPWPAMPSLDAFPQAVAAVEALLGKRFLRTAQLHGPSLKTSDFATLAGWLRPVCDALDCTLGAVNGPLPARAVVDDDPAARAGVRLVLPVAADGAA